MLRFYTGIGSRHGVPADILVRLEQIGALMAQNEFILRSGGAEGCDTAFEKGCLGVGGKIELYLPWGGFNGRSNQEHIACNHPSSEAFAVAADSDPKWCKRESAYKLLIGRNMHQVLGKDLNSPSDLVICWHPGYGGTTKATELAQFYDIPTYNLAKSARRKELKIFLDKLG